MTPFSDLSVITEDGLEYQLMRSAIHPVFLDGAGIIPVRRILDKAPLQQGMTDRGFRQDARRMTLQLMLEGKSPADADKLRDQVAQWFVPTNTPLRLKVTRDDMQVRQIDCYVDGTIDFPRSNQIGSGQLVTVPLVAPNPSWYLPTQQVVESALLEATDVDIDINVAGTTADDWPIISITGPVDVGLTIKHYPGYAASYPPHAMAFTSAIAALQTINIDLRPGYKTIRNQLFANRMNYLDQYYLGAFSEMRIMSEHTTRATDPAWSTSNRFRFHATGVSGASKATISYYRRYASL